MQRVLSGLVFLVLVLAVTGSAHPDFLFTRLDVPGASSTQADGINASGQIVGFYTDASGNDHGFLFSGGSYTTLNVPGAATTHAVGINASGQIAGWFYDGNFH